MIIDLQGFYYIEPDTKRFFSLPISLHFTPFESEDDIFKRKYNIAYGEELFNDKVRDLQQLFDNIIEIRYMRFEMGAAFSYSNRIVDSELLGPVPTSQQAKQEYWKKAREIGLRVVFFHEMVHVLQIAYRNELAKLLEENEIYNYPKLQVSMEGLMPERFLWPESVFVETDNFVVQMEAQRTLLAHQMVVNIFDMNQTQEKILWDCTGAGKRVSQVRLALVKIRELYKQNELYLSELYYFPKKAKEISKIATLLSPTLISANDFPILIAATFKDSKSVSDDA